MTRVLRDNALCACMALLGTVTMVWMGLIGFAWTDYEVEVLPSYQALVHGHLSAFLRLVPAYGGSLIERAPFALLPGLWSGGDLAVYRSVALPCLLAAAALGVYLVAYMRGSGHSTLARAVALGICVANPITLRGLEFGHPEDLLGGCMCVAAVLLAARDRPLLAGLVLGLAIANKEWALLAAGPVLLVLPTMRRRLWCSLCAGVSTVAVLAPIALASTSAFASSARVVAAPQSPDFQPWQVWWFFGVHGRTVIGAFGIPKIGYRIGPSWTTLVSHPSVILFGAIVAGALWLRVRGRALPLRDALLALALVMLMRCLLDTWDTIYYTMPFVLALLAWETHTSTRPPVLALSCTVLMWLSFYWLPQHATPDVQSAAFLAWSLPFAAWMAVRLFISTRPALAGGSARGGSRGEARQEMTVNSFGRLVSTS